MLRLFAVAPVAAAGLAAAELFGLNKSPRENLAGEGDGFAAVAVFLRVPFVLGVTAGEAAGLAAVLASAFLRPRLDFGAAAGDAAVSLADPVVSVFLCARRFAGAPAGDSPGLGD